MIDELGAGSTSPTLMPLKKPPLPTGKLTPETIGLSVAALMPENAVVAEEAISSGASLIPSTATAEPHDWMFTTGGAIGQGLPNATGAALACPDRKVLGLQADGSAMYTVQALWTQARESLDVTTVVFANRKYRILSIEYKRVGAGRRRESPFHAGHRQPGYRLGQPGKRGGCPGLPRDDYGGIKPATGRLPGRTGTEPDRGRYLIVPGDGFEIRPHFPFNPGLS